LRDIEHLRGPPSQIHSINAIKCAALNGQYVLDEFAGKIRKYEKSLGDGTSTLRKGKENPIDAAATRTGQGTTLKRGWPDRLTDFKGSAIRAGEKITDGAKKVKWELFMKEDVRDLRSYLTSHVGSLNMRMITQGLYVFLDCELSSLRN
jgi:hypothetical protein